MKSSVPIAIASRSLSKNERLCDQIIKQFSNVRINKTGAILEGDSLVKFLTGSRGAIIGLEPVTERVLSRLPELKVISKYGVGLDNIDLVSMKRRGIKLGWSGGVNSISVAELTLAFALGLMRGIFKASFNLSRGHWERVPNQELSGKTYGIVGCGNIGKQVAMILSGFRCKVLVHDILEMRPFCKKVGATQVSLAQLLRQSDVISIHVPYDKSTHCMIAEKEFRLMKRSAFLINTARGNIVDEKALYRVLKSGQLAGAGFDVFAVEPADQNKLFKLHNFFGTPHMGGSSFEAMNAMGTAAIENLQNLLRRI